MLTKRILIIDDEDFISLNLQSIFMDEGYHVETEVTGNAGVNAVKENNYDLVFLDINLPDINGIEVLKEIKKIDPELLVIIITGFASIETAVDSIKLGAYDYIKKPFKADAIKLITRLALETQSLKKKVEKLESQQRERFGIESIIGTSDVITKVKDAIVEFARHDSGNVLISGESGTGKELIASAIHSLSPRSDKAFVEINCAAIPETLLEAELFGYEKGAFTDARNKKTGLLEIADGGTLFLDEIGEMSISLQAKLLRVLENHKIRRIGSVKDVSVDIRIIAATNKDLSLAIEKSEFREDFFYRLNVLSIKSPPLRERQDDIILLAKYFLNSFKIKFAKNIETFSPEALEAIKNYSWPGNVRELKNLLERTCILADSEVIHLEDIENFFSTGVKKQKEPEFEIDFTNNSLDGLIEEYEFKIISKALEISNANISSAARFLKIPRETLRYKIKKLGIKTSEE